MTIQEDFVAYEAKNPMSSDFICLAHVIRGRHLTREEVKKAFRLVPREEYVGVDKEKLIDHLYKLSLSNG
jgi:hypothetical protein